MNEELSGVAKRLAGLRAKLVAREGKKEYEENCKQLRAEISSLESVTLKPLASKNGQEYDL